MTTEITDAEIFKHRALKATVLGSSELVAMRREIQSLYADSADASRRAAATSRHLGGYALAELPAVSEAAASDEGWTDYCRAGRRQDKSEKLISETGTRADEAADAYMRASMTYERRRREALALVGCDETIAALSLAEERARDEAHETRLLTLPPVGWGEKRYPALDERIAAWQRRPAFERRSTLGERVQIAA